MHAPQIMHFLRVIFVFVVFVKFMLVIIDAFFKQFSTGFFMNILEFF